MFIIFKLLGQSQLFTAIEERKKKTLFFSLRDVSFYFATKKKEEEKIEFYDLNL